MRHLGHRVHDQADALVPERDQQDARVRIRWRGRQQEPLAQVDHRHDRAPHVDHSLDELRSVRHPPRLLECDHLLDLLHLHAELVRSEPERNDGDRRGGRVFVGHPALPGILRRVAPEQVVRPEHGDDTLLVLQQERPVRSAHLPRPGRCRAGDRARPLRDAQHRIHREREAHGSAPDDQRGGRHGVGPLDLEQRRGIDGRQPFAPVLEHALAVRRQPGQRPRVDPVHDFLDQRGIDGEPFVRDPDQHDLPRAHGRRHARPSTRLATRSAIASAMRSIGSTSRANRAAERGMP